MQNMFLTKEEFKILVLLYAANADGNIHDDEVDLMLEKTNSDTFHKVKKLFSKMSDVDVLECIRLNKAKYVATDEERQRLMNDLKQLIAADEHCSPMENFFYNALGKLL